MMPDFLSIFERTLKAVRFGIFQASDQLALALDGLCRAPEVYPRYEMTAPGSFVILDSAASPQVAVVAPSPKQGSDSPPRDSAILQAPSGGTQTSIPEPDLSHEEIAAVRRLLEDYGEALDAASQFFKPQK